MIMWNRNQNSYHGNPNHGQVPPGFNLRPPPGNNEQYPPFFRARHPRGAQPWANFHPDSRPVRFIQQSRINQPGRTFPIQEQNFAPANNSFSSADKTLYDVEHKAMHCSPNKTSYNTEPKAMHCSPNNTSYNAEPKAMHCSSNNTSYNAEPKAMHCSPNNTSYNAEPKAIHCSPNKSSPVFTTANTSEEHELNVIPFIGNRTETNRSWNNNNNNRVTGKSSFIGEHKAIVTSSSSTGVSTAWSAEKNAVPFLNNEGENSRYDSNSYGRNSSNREHQEQMEVTSFPVLGNVTKSETPPSRLSNAEGESEKNRIASSMRTSEDDQGAIPLSISQVLGDSKILSDILSVAKTIQFSEQSKSLNFLSVSTSNKNIAIVPPISHQSDTAYSSDSLVTTAFSQGDADRRNYSGFPTQQQNSWTNKVQAQNSSTVQLTNRKRPFEEIETDSASDGRLKPPKFSTFGQPRSFIHKNIDSFSSAVYSSDLNETLKVKERTDSMVCNITVDSAGNDWTDSSKDVPSIISEKARKMDSPVLSTYAARSPSPSSKPDADKELKDLSRAPSPEPQCDENVMTMIFEHLAKCAISTDSDAEAVLQVITTLTEMYLKFKLSFVPDAKFESLMKSLKEAKEKETNFILNYLKCSSATRSTPFAEESSVAAEKQDVDDEQSVTNPVPANDSCISSVATDSSQQSSLSNTSMAQQMSFIPMYASGAMGMPPGYWPSMTSTGAPPPPLPPMQFAPMNPPLPPQFGQLAFSPMTPVNCRQSPLLTMTQPPIPLEVLQPPPPPPSSQG